MKKIDLRNYGWSDFFENKINSQDKELTIARIIKKHNLGYDIICQDGTYFTRIRGKLRKELPKSSWPVIGDWVLCSLCSDYAMIEKILPRKSKISRKMSGKTSEEQIIAANADIICLVISVYIDFNPRRIERYLTLAAESGAKPILILNKIDLVDNIEDFINETKKLIQDIPIFLTNALIPETLLELYSYIKKGETIVFLGSSGAGKSTIVNVLLGEEKQVVSSIGKHKKGRHTTSSRDMVIIPNGGILIDNPGIRELRIWLDDDNSLKESFADIERLAKQCQFRDCKHDLEPNCIVQEAIKLKKIDQARVDSWRKLEEEALELLVRRQELGKKITKQSSRIAKFLKHNKSKSSRYHLR